MFFWMLQTMFGLIFLNRILCSKLFFVVEDDPKQISTSIFCNFIYILIAILLRNYFFTQSLMIFAMPIFIYALRALWLHQQKSIFQKNIVQILDQIIMCMRSGRSMKEALRMVAHENTGFIQFQIQEIIHFLNYPSQNTKDHFLLVSEIKKELLSIQNNPSKAVDQIKSMRYKYKIEQDFRRRSRQASLQAQIQSIIMSFLYLSLLFYVIFQHGLAKNLKIILISLFLFSIGAIFSHFIGRNLKWKV